MDSRKSQTSSTDSLTTSEVLQFKPFLTIPLISILLSEMESAIKELNGLGWFQMRATLLVALPLTGFPGFMQMQVFFGQILPHECENDTNKTGSIVAKYIRRNLSDCGDCSMETSYANDFGLLCDNKDSMPYLQRYFITVLPTMHMFGSFTVYMRPGINLSLVHSFSELYLVKLFGEFYKIGDGSFSSGFRV